MTLALVHGNPETAAVWERLVDALGRTDVVCLSPPGFGSPASAGWPATPTAYRDWLIGELEAIGHPVDLLGHDWGGAHAVNVAMTRPDLLRTWCSDTPGWFEPDYAWHALARTWQTPGAGEAAAAAMTHPDVRERAGYLTSLGIPADIAGVLAAGAAEVSAACVLKLYRSAAQPTLVKLGRQLEHARRRPGLTLIATEDHGSGSEEHRRRAAGRAGASVATLHGLGHWWMLQDPPRAADLLRRFWATCHAANVHPVP